MVAGGEAEGLPNEEDVRDQEELEERVADGSDGENGGKGEGDDAHDTPSHPSMRQGELLRKTEKRLAKLERQFERTLTRQKRDQSHVSTGAEDRSSPPPGGVCSTETFSQFTSPIDREQCAYLFMADSSEPCVIVSNDAEQRRRKACLQEIKLFFPANATIRGSWQDARWAARSS